MYRTVSKKSVWLLRRIIQVQLSRVQTLQILTAQFAVFIRDVDEDFQLVDEPLELVSLKEKQILAKFVLNA